MSETTFEHVAPDNNASPCPVRADGVRRWYCVLPGGHDGPHVGTTEHPGRVAVWGVPAATDDDLGGAAMSEPASPWAFTTSTGAVREAYVWGGPRVDPSDEQVQARREAFDRWLTTVRPDTPAPPDDADRFHDIAHGVSEAYTPEGQAIWWRAWAMHPDQRARMEAGILAAWSGEPTDTPALSDADRDALVGLLRAHHGDVTELMRYDGATRCLCGEWVAWNAWEEHLVGVIEAHYAEKVTALLHQWSDPEWGFMEDEWRFVRDLRAMFGIKEDTDE